MGCQEYRKNIGRVKIKGVICFPQYNHSEVASVREARTKDSKRHFSLQSRVHVTELQKINHRVEQEVSSAKSTTTAIRCENSDTLKSLDCKSFFANSNKLEKLHNDIIKINTERSQ